ncbi:Plasmid stabilization system protein [Planctomycetes bacterium MalM25]|nr:Plasmid stabilization system protein [Planctomycetes bacterium MalM25]
MTYAVLVTPAAKAEIYEFIDYVANVKQEPLNADRLVDVIDEGILSLRRLPQRCPHPPENDLVPFEVRSLVLKKTLVVLYHVNEERQRVEVLGFRHGRRSPLDLSSRQGEPS